MMTTRIFLFVVVRDDDEVVVMDVGVNCARHVYVLALFSLMMLLLWW